MKNIDLSNPIKKEIVKIFQENDRISLGKLVSVIREPYNEILEHLLDLKNKGVISKEKGDLGYFRLNENYKNITL